MLLLILALLWLLGLVVRRPVARSAGRRCVAAPRPILKARKPDWVTEEVVRLKALMPDAGCRRIADTFNRLHAARHATTVGKTWVGETVRKRSLEIARRRAELKHRVPRSMPANHIWAMDLTAKRDLAGTVHPILGLVDHGTRAAIVLGALADKSSITLLRVLLAAIERYGKPRTVRTDNEAIFTSRLFRFGLAVLRIRHQRIEPHCPWMNGRVERFFGTLKGRLDHWAVVGRDELVHALGDFRAWYNHVRPHQHLFGRTPAEAWDGIDPVARPPRTASVFSAWDGLLTGFYMRR